MDTDDGHPSPAGNGGAPEGEAAWDERYAASPTIWSGRANHALVTLVEGRRLPAGRALDVGCGEGGDAVYLASLGWRVTGTDISGVALARAAGAAAEADVAGRTEWVHADLSAGPLPAGPFDLVSAQYLHQRPDLRSALWAALAAVVAPGGTLLVVGHDPSDPHVAAHLAEAGEHAADMAGRFHGPDEVVAALGGGWEVRRAATVDFTRDNHTPGPAADVVVEAVRTGRP